MKILLILPQIPFPPHSGGRIVTWNTLIRFAKRASVHVVCLYHHPSELEALDEVKKHAVEVAAFPAYSKWSLWPMLRSSFSLKPYKAHRFYNKKMARYIERLLWRESIDVIHAQNFYTAIYVPKKHQALTVHYKENLEGNLLLQLGRYSRNPIMKLLSWLEGKRTLRYECRIAERFDQILTISPVDGDRLQELNLILRVEHQAAGVDVEHYSIDETPRDNPSVIFTGQMSYYPNTDGAQFLVQDVWPLVRHAVPNAECWIVGDKPPSSLTRFDGVDGIRVTGWVEEIRDYIRSAWVVVVPLRMGGGIRLKILESMAMGKAIVSTPVGCEGLNVVDGEQLYIADGLQAFSESLIHLLQTPSSRWALRHNARKFVEEHYNWDMLVSQQLQLYQALLEQKASMAEEA